MDLTNMQIFDETTRILAVGRYACGGKEIRLPHSRGEQSRATVYLPEDIEEIRTKGTPAQGTGGRIDVRCENRDSFSAARSLLPQEVLVLNFANPFEPGGGVRRGARAQEEDLCRRSSLLLSLESEAAAKYYAYHRERRSRLSSDAIVITPNADVFRDENGDLLEKPFSVAVMTCAAPMVDFGYEGLSERDYRALFARRIDGMLRVAAHLGYRALVLGAFGCGAFGNDAAVVSDLFYTVMKEFRFSGMRLEDCFRSICFAVLSRDPAQYNLKEFQRNFSDYDRDR